MTKKIVVAVCIGACFFFRAFPGLTRTTVFTSAITTVFRVAAGSPDIGDSEASPRDIDYINAVFEARRFDRFTGIGVSGGVSSFDQWKTLESVGATKGFGAPTHLLTEKNNENISAEPRDAGTAAFTVDPFQTVALSLAATDSPFLPASKVVRLSVTRSEASTTDDAAIAARRSCIGFVGRPGSSADGSCSLMFKAFFEANSHANPPFFSLAAAQIPHVICGGTWVSAGTHYFNEPALSAGRQGPMPFGDTERSATETLLHARDEPDSIVFSLPWRVVEEIVGLRHGDETEFATPLLPTVCFLPDGRDRDAVSGQAVATIRPLLYPEIRVTTGVDNPVPSTHNRGGKKMFRISVRSFLDPGWDAVFSVRGRAFSPFNLIAIKAETGCRSFAGARAYRVIRPTAILDGFAQKQNDFAGNSGLSNFWTTRGMASPSAAAVISLAERLEEQRSTFQSAEHDVYFSAAERAVADTSSNLSTAIFAVSVNHKAEPNDLGRWRAFAKGRERRLAIEAAAAERKRRHVSPPGGKNEAGAKFGLCFYADNQTLEGLELGQVSFYADHADSGMLVGFVIFTVVGVPFLTGVTLSCYSHRHQKLRKQLRRIRLSRQRDSIERRLMEHFNVDSPQSI